LLFQKIYLWKIQIQKAYYCALIEDSYIWHQLCYVTVSFNKLKNFNFPKYFWNSLTWVTEHFQVYKIKSCRETLRLLKWKSSCSSVREIVTADKLPLKCHSWKLATLIWNYCNLILLSWRQALAAILHFKVSIVMPMSRVINWLIHLYSNFLSTLSSIILAIYNHIFLTILGSEFYGWD